MKRRSIISATEYEAVKHSVSKLVKSFGHCYFVAELAKSFGRFYSVAKLVKSFGSSDNATESLDDFRYPEACK